MGDIDTNLTADLLLAGECGLFCGLLLRRWRVSAQVARYAWLFAALGLASLLGAILPGPLPPRFPALSDMLWPVTMLALGGAPLCLWLIAAGKLPGGPWPRRIRWLAVLQATLYAVVVPWLSDAAGLVALNALPAMLTLLAIHLTELRRGWMQRPACGAAGLTLALIAAPLLLPSHPSAGWAPALAHFLPGVAVALLFFSVPAPPRR